MLTEVKYKAAIEIMIVHCTEIHLSYIYNELKKEKDQLEKKIKKLSEKRRINSREIYEVEKELFDLKRAMNAILEALHYKNKKTLPDYKTFEKELIKNKLFLELLGKETPLSFWNKIKLWIKKPKKELDNE